MAVTGKITQKGSLDFILRFLKGPGTKPDDTYYRLPMVVTPSHHEYAVRKSLQYLNENIESLKIHTRNPILGVGATCVVLNGCMDTPVEEASRPKRGTRTVSVN